jgi:hypothetical protein
MAHSEISYQSHGSRVAKAIGGALIGLLLFVISPFVLFFNEGRAVQTEKSLTEGSKAVKNIPADKVDKANDGKLVALNGEATTEETLADPDFKVSAAKAIKLVREVEMYQWQEHKESKTLKNSNGSTYTVTTYTYDQGWSSHHIDSETFSENWHENPKAMKYEGKTVVAKNVTLGAFTLNPELVEKIETSGPVTVEKKPAELKALKAVLDKGDIYLGASPAHPAVGDLRVHYKVIAPMKVSVVAQQSGSSFVPYQTSAGDALLLLKEGVLDGSQMFEAAQADNVAMTWVLRFLGWLMMLIGLGLVFRPVAVIGDRFPLLGTLAGAGLALSAFLLASGLSLLTIGIAWLFYRPLLGILLLAAAGGAGYFYVRRIKAKKAEKAAAGDSSEPAMAKAA